MVGSEIKKLSRTEFNLLAFLMDHPGCVFTREVLLEIYGSRQVKWNTRAQWTCMCDAFAKKLKQTLPSQRDSSHGEVTGTLSSTRWTCLTMRANKLRFFEKASPQSKTLRLVQERQVA